MGAGWSRVAWSRAGQAESQLGGVGKGWLCEVVGNGWVGGAG